MVSTNSYIIFFSSHDTFGNAADLAKLVAEDGPDGEASLVLQFVAKRSHILRVGRPAELAILSRTQPPVAL